MLPLLIVTALSSTPEHVHAALLLQAGGITVNQATTCPECETLKEQLR